MKALQQVLLSLLVTEIAAVPKAYDLLKFDNCQEDMSIVSFVKFANSSELPLDTAKFSGYFEIREKVTAPLELLLDPSKCDLSMKKCDKLSIVRIPGLCDIFNSRNGMFELALKTFQPRLGCPMMPGKYIAKDSVLDLKPFAVFPTHGYIWVVTVKALSGTGKNKRVVFCINSETKMSRMRRRKGGN